MKNEERLPLPDDRLENAAGGRMDAVTAARLCRLVAEARKKVGVLRAETTDRMDFCELDRCGRALDRCYTALLNADNGLALAELNTAAERLSRVSGCSVSEISEKLRAAIGLMEQGL